MTLTLKEDKEMKIIEGKCGDFYLESGDIMLMFSRWERGIATLSLWRDCHYLCEVLDKDAFYKPQPYASWTLNSTTYYWEPPVTYPSDGKEYIWNESAYQADNSKGWVEI